MVSNSYTITFNVIAITLNVFESKDELETRDFTAFLSFLN